MTYIDKLINDWQDNLIPLVSRLLEDGYTKDIIYKVFYDYFINNDLSDDVEENITDVLNLMTGIHNPNTQVVNCVGVVHV